MPDSLRKQLWLIFKDIQQKPTVTETNIFDTINSVEAALSKAHTETATIEAFKQQVIDEALAIRSSLKFVRFLYKTLVGLLGQEMVPPCISLVKGKKGT